MGCRYHGELQIHLCAWEDHRAFLLEAALRYMQEEEVSWDSQHAFFQVLFFICLFCFHFNLYKSVSGYLILY